MSHGEHISQAWANAPTVHMPRPETTPEPQTTSRSDWTLPQLQHDTPTTPAQLQNPSTQAQAPETDIPPSPPEARNIPRTMERADQWDSDSACS
eukprot:11320980-Prorocentrum_lima.AAC.1